MALPPGFLDELRSRTSIGDVVGRKVVWDMRKSNQAKGDLWAPCPFHQEKTASFHVEDRKGFYYCFGCHAKGDIFKFVQETENVGFMEAVEILSREAGMAMPAPDPQAREKADRRTELAATTEAAVQHFRLQLKTQSAASARDYLDGRGLSAATLERFEIGFAPNQRQGTFQALTGKGIEAEKLDATGLCTTPDDGCAPYDAFRDRIIFPIRDPRGVVIGFGGRAMDPNARAKYLNSRETELFDKGRALYNHAPAREAAGQGQALIVAEGYMDVIALSQAGFEASVAPLGTAVTEEQLRLIWKMADEPIIALDGDKAGLRAAMRLIDIALPMLVPGKTLRFALMPEGQDPDDILRSQGAGAMQAILDQAQPMVALLWRRETEGKTFDTPERKAALDQTLRQAIARIPDPSVRHHYGQAINDLRWQAFRNAPKGRVRRGFDAGPSEATQAAKGSALAGGAFDENSLRIGLILAGLLHHPALIDDFEAELERLDAADPGQIALTDYLLATNLRDKEAIFEEIKAKNLGAALEGLLGQRHLIIHSWIRAPDRADTAKLCLAEEFAKLAARRGIEHELSEGREEIAASDGSSHLRWRLNQAVETRQAAEQPQTSDGTGDTHDLEEIRARFRNVVQDAGKNIKEG
ncbi:MAG: DNA primase [Pseudomonadota bacterium]